MQRAVKGLVAVCLGLFMPAFGYAQSALEVPASGSFVSGLGFVAGWKCSAVNLTFSIDNGPSAQLVYGVSRNDTQGTCGHSGTGFIAEENWNLAGDGQHTLRVFDNGTEFAEATFTVTTLGTDFLRGQSATCSTDIAGQSVTLGWQENQQNFALISAGGATSQDFNGYWDITKCSSGFCLQDPFSWKIVQNGTNVSITAVSPNPYAGGACTTVSFDTFDSLQVSGETLSGKEYEDTTDLACGFRSTSTFTVSLTANGQSFSGTGSEYTYEECSADYSEDQTI